MRMLKNLDETELRGKVVLVRADLNIPVQNGKVTDSARIDRLKPTIDKLRQAGAKTVILSHFGRPKGQHVPEMSLSFLPEALEEIWGFKPDFCPETIGENVRKHCEEMQNGDIILLENVRFHPGEEKNDPEFAHELAGCGDLFVHDAFSAAHRAHASTKGLADHLPSYAGYLMEAEITALQDALESPERPLVAIVGGAKISTKLELLDNLSHKADTLVLGGGMANTFLHANGIQIGKSLCEKDMAEQARQIYQNAKSRNCRIYLPVDAVCAAELKPKVQSKTYTIDNIPQDQMILDIGPQSAGEIEAILAEAKTAVWNGPLGAFETKPFDNGTRQVAKALAKLTQASDLISVAGGGDTLAAIQKSGISGQLSYVSTAGGAFLEWLEGKSLPGVKALK